MGLFPSEVDGNLHPALFFDNPIWLISRFYDDEKNRRIIHRALKKLTDLDDNFSIHFKFLKKVAQSCFFSIKFAVIFLE